MRQSKYNLQFDIENFGFPQYRTTDPRVQSVAEVLRKPGQILRSLEDDAATISADPTATEGAKKMKIAALAKRRAEMLTNTLADAQGRAAVEITKIGEVIGKAYDPKSVAEETRIASELATLAMMDRKERDDYIRTALNNDDALIIKAIATRPPNPRYAAPYAYREAIAKFERMAAPDDFDVRADLEDVLAAVEQATARAHDIIDSDFIQPAEQIERSASAARAITDKDADHAEAV